ncbi:MAG: UbiX family flavin prenyltransferase [Bdellovibrionales bacterium]|nr:UbiX family flavin prenyltransferase [Bdellovibrionales bacterium]
MFERAGSHRWIVGVSGASGTVYARRLIESLLQHDERISLDIVFSEAALRVMREEEGIAASVSTLRDSLIDDALQSRATFHNNRDIGASIASGSSPVAGMVIVPCSMGTIAAVAAGLCDSLIRRAADVTLKEGRTLIVVPRETPLSPIQLENMLKLSRSGVSVLPAMPGFYHQPRTISDLVDMMVEKIADRMGYQLGLVERWKSSPWPVASVTALADKSSSSGS